MLGSFRQHWGLKLMALVFAVFLWFYVHNATNPAVVRSFAVPLQYESEPFNGQVRNRNRLVTVLVGGEKQRVDTVQAADIHAYALLKSADMGKTEVPIRFRRTEALRGLTLEARPKSEIVEIGQQVTRTFATRAVLSGEVPESFAIAAAPVVTPRTVSVTGWKEDVARVNSVAVPVDLSKIQGNVEANFPVVALDASGTPVPSTQVKIVPEEALVRFQLTPLPTSKTVYVNVLTTGRPPFPVTIASIQCSPSQVTLVGDPGQIKRISVIDTEPIALNDVIASRKVTSRLRLPTGVRSKNGPTVRVHIAVK